MEQEDLVGTGCCDLWGVSVFWVAGSPQRCVGGSGASSETQRASWHARCCRPLAARAKCPYLWISWQRFKASAGVPAQVVPIKLPGVAATSV